MNQNAKEKGDQILKIQLLGILLPLPKSKRSNNFQITSRKTRSEDTRDCRKKKV